MAITISGKPIGKAGSAFDKHLGDAPPLTAKVIKGSTTVEKKKGKEVVSTIDKEETVGEAGFIAPHKLFHVHVSGSMTKNLGNYESAKITVGITVPCSMDNLASMYDFGSDWVSEKIETALKEMTGAE